MQMIVMIIEEMISGEKLKISFGAWKKIISETKFLAIDLCVPKPNRKIQWLFQASQNHRQDSFANVDIFVSDKSHSQFQHPADEMY